MFMEEVFNPVENRPTLSEETITAWRENRYGPSEQAIELPDDMSEQYNTQLNDEQEKQYTQWAKEQGRELDVQNYDLRGAWLEMQSNSSMSEDERGHLGDKYKKPNHPTFSAESIYNGKEGVQGGKWEQNGAIWSYTPGRKLTKDQAKRLEKYFQEHEAGNYLNLKDKVYKDPAMFVPGTTPGWFDGFTDVLWKPMLDAAFRFTSTGLMAASKGMFWVRDDFREQIAKASEDLDAWTRANLGPDPQTMGTATQILYGLMNTLPELALFMTGAGGAAGLVFRAAAAGHKVRTAQLAIGSAMFGTDMGVAERNRLVNEGVDKDTAFWAGMSSGITNTIGVAIPPFLGASRTMSAIYGGVSNVGINYAELKTIQYVLENQNYNELAQQYQLGLTDTVISATLGAVMGAAFWRHPTQVKYEKAYARLYDRYKSDLDAGGKFTKEQTGAMAVMNSRAVLSLAKMVGVSPDKIDDFAAKITWSEDRKTLSVPEEYAMKIGKEFSAEEKLRLEVNDWIGRIGALTEKPRQPLLMLKQTPVVMHLVGADFLELRAHPHFFDGMFPKADKSSPNHHAHTEMDKEMIGQIPEAITDPIAITRDDRNNSYIFILDLKNKKGDAVVVPVRFSATGKNNANINLVKTAFGRDGESWLELQGINNALRYVNTEKLKRLEDKPGAISLRAPNASTQGGSKFTNSDGTTVLTQNDLVKAKEEIKLRTGQEVYQIGYHGSPYIFDAFTLAHIGTGEGAQVHGYGLYFALARMRAERYREALSESGDVLYLNGKPIGTKWPVDGSVRERMEYEVGGYLQSAGKDVPLYSDDDVRQAINRVRERKQRIIDLENWYSAKDKKAAKEDLAELKRMESHLNRYSYSSKYKRGGRLYTVDIPNDDVLLREEFAFDAQPKEVQDALLKLFGKELSSEQLNKVYRNQWYNDAMEQMQDYSDYISVPNPVLRALDKLAKEEGPQIFADEKRVLKKISKALDEAANERYLEEKEYYDKKAGKKKKGIDLARKDVIDEAGLNSDGLFFTLLDVAETKYPSLLSGEPKFEFTDGINGRQIYEQIAEFVGSEKEASALLNKYGVKGIRYTGMQDGECAVIWDEKSIKILEYLQQGQEGIRGAFNPSTNTIRLTPNANLSTFSHEHAHWYLTNVLSLAGKEGATLELQTQAMAILKMFGIKSLKDWEALGFEGQRKYQEQFASLTELYLTEGKSAVPGLEGVFKKFAEWLLDMYKSVLGKDADGKAQAKEIGDRYEAQFGEKLPELSPDVRKVLDKMYGAQEKFVPTKGQTAAARVVQAVRVNADKINAPIENAAASPEVANRAAAIQGKAESDLNNGQKVDVSSEVGDLPENAPVVNEAQHTFGRAVAVGDGNQSRAVVLQNRDRSSPTSVAQMNSIAADPQYGRLSVSRTTQSGAPIVSFGQIPDQRFQGKSDVLTDSNGDKVPVTYFVVEADSVMRSNNVDGSPNPQWSEDHPEAMRAVAGNGRMAGLNEAYNRGTAEKYREELIADEANHGVSADVIRGMKKPVLVRYMDPDNVTTGFVERSNTSDVLVRSALETAVQDSPKVRKNIDKYDFDENGDPTRETLGQFLTDVGETSEMGNLLGSDGQPTTTARNRIRAALFYEAYRDNRLTELVADSEDKQGMKRILNAMSAFAPRVIEIREASNGAIDLGPVITGAVNRILQARINGEGVDFSLQTDMFDSNPVTDIFSQFFSNNKNSTAAMLRVLRPFADDLQNRLKAADSPLFEEEAVKTDLADAIGLFRQAENNEIRAKRGDLLGDSTDGLLPDINVADLRNSIARTVQPATELVSSIAEGVRDTNAAATPEAKAARLNEHLAEQARAREVLGADSEAARARNMLLEDADRVVTVNDANGNPIQVRAADLFEHTKTMDQELENDVSGLGTGVACIIRNQGIRP